MTAKPKPRPAKKPAPPRPPSARKAAKAAGPRKKPANGTATDFEAMLRETSLTQRYELKLYVTGTSPRSGQAIANVRSLCEEYLPGRYDLEVIDIYQQPGVAASEQIIAAPTLIKKFPAPSRRLIGDLSNRDKILVGLNLVARSAADTRWLEL